MKIYKKILDVLKDISQIIVLVGILGIIAIMLSELVVRNIFNISFRWSTELNGFLFMWMAFMGLITLIDDDRLILLDMVYTRVPDKMRKLFWCIIRVAYIFLGAVMVIAYADMYPVLATSKFSTMQWLPKTWHYLPCAITGAYMALYGIYDMLNSLRRGAQRGTNR